MASIYSPPSPPSKNYRFSQIAMVRRRRKDWPASQTLASLCADVSRSLRVWWAGINEWLPIIKMAISGARGVQANGIKVWQTAAAMDTAWSVLATGGPSADTAAPGAPFPRKTHSRAPLFNAFMSGACKFYIAVPIWISPRGRLWPLSAAYRAGARKRRNRCDFYLFVTQGKKQRPRGEHRGTKVNTTGKDHWKGLTVDCK